MGLLALLYQGTVSVIEADGEAATGSVDLKEVESLHTTSGRFDLAAQVGAPDTAQLDSALDRIAMIEGVRGIETLVQLTTKVDRRW